MTSPWGKTDSDTEPPPRPAWPKGSWAEMIDSRFDAEGRFKDGASYRAGSLAGLEMILMAFMMSFYAVHNTELPSSEEVEDIFETCGLSDGSWVITQEPLELLYRLLKEMKERIEDDRGRTR